MKTIELKVIEGTAPHHYYDDRYMEAYLDNPKAGKSAALTKAGYVGDYLAQEAYRIHNRLKDKIRAKVDSNIQDGGDVGFHLLLELAKDDTIPASVKATVAVQLLNYAGRKPTDTLIVKQEKDIKEIEAELALLERDMALTGISSST